MQSLAATGCDRLNRLGVRRMADPSLAAEIEALVRELFDLDLAAWTTLLETGPVR